MNKITMYLREWRMQWLESFKEENRKKGPIIRAFAEVSFLVLLVVLVYSLPSLHTVVVFEFTILMSLMLVAGAVGLLAMKLLVMQFPYTSVAGAVSAVGELTAVTALAVLYYLIVGTLLLNPSASDAIEVYPVMDRLSPCALPGFLGGAILGVILAILGVFRPFRPVRVQVRDDDLR